MKRFRFSLRPVAMLRAHRDTRAREAFATAVHLFVQAEEELARTRVRMRALEGALFSGRQQTFRASEAALLLADYRRECANEADVEGRVTTARDEMHRRRDDYLEAHRELEVVQRLEEKARTHHRHEVERGEQAEADDFANHRHATRPVSVSA
jgi:flagellar FliJ protein